MAKTASTREIIEYLQAYEKQYGIGSVESIGSVCSGSRETEYIFHVEDKNGKELTIEIPSLEKEQIWKTDLAR